MLMQCKKIKKAYDVAGNSKFWALKGIDLDIPKKSLIILKGRSGSGKTTLLNILGALDRPTEGEVIFDGKSLSLARESFREDTRRKSMGFVFQSVGLIPILNAYENVDFALRMAGCNYNKHERIEEVISMVGLLDRAKHKPTEMSGGEQQRIAIARSIAHRPKIIFADEPTGALDTVTGLKIMNIFKNMIEKEGSTIVMTTHDPGLMEFGDYVYEIEDGEIIGREQNTYHG